MKKFIKGFARSIFVLLLINGAFMLGLVIDELINYPHLDTYEYTYEGVEYSSLGYHNDEGKVSPKRRFTLWLTH